MSFYYNELDPFAAAWLRELIKAGYIAPGEVDERSITEVQPDDLKGFTQYHFFAGIGVWSYALRQAGWPDDRPVWTGSCPCPSFSAAGKGAGFNDPRHLWPDWHRLIRERRPAIVFGEQVDAAIGHGWLDLVQSDLEAAEYAVGKAVLGACSVGAPHRRQRLYFVAKSARDGRQHEQAVGRFDEQGMGARESRQQFGIELGEAGRVARRPEAGALGHRVADAECGAAERQRFNMGAAPRGFEGEAQERQRIRLDAGDGEHAGRMADTEHADGRAEHQEHGDAHGRDGLGRSGATGELDNPASPRCDGERQEPESQARNEARQRGPERGRATGANPKSPIPNPYFTNGFWADAEWLWCRDGKYRPVEPGTFPLVAGAPARVGRLRGYGNAVCAPLAQAFIEAYLDL